MNTLMVKLIHTQLINQKTVSQYTSKQVAHYMQNYHLKLHQVT